jgi:hypothetical protein
MRDEQELAGVCVKVEALPKTFLDMYLGAFHDLLRKINGSNVVISGAVALLAHGLQFRKPSDLDISIYIPTGDQKQILDALSCLAENSKEYCFDKRVYRFVKNGWHADIVIEKEGYPRGLLTYEFCGDIFKIQSIDNVIAAKRKYNREKDWKDLAALKHDNFNL